jgi:hypothetical protein
MASMGDMPDMTRQEISIGSRQDRSPPFFHFRIKMAALTYISHEPNIIYWIYYQDKMVVPLLK